MYELKLLNEEVFPLEKQENWYYIEKVMLYRYYPFGGTVTKFVDQITRNLIANDYLRENRDVNIFKCAILRSYYDWFFENYPMQIKPLVILEEKILKSKQGREEVTKDPIIKNLATRIEFEKQRTKIFFKQYPDLWTQKITLQNHNKLFNTFYTIYNIVKLVKNKGEKKFEEIIAENKALNNTLNISFEKIKTLTEIKRNQSLKLAAKSNRENFLERLPTKTTMREYAENCRFRNGKINYSKLAKLIHKTNQTAKRWCKELGIE